MWLAHYERTCFVIMGVVHGLTNLGGSLLTGLVHTRTYPKARARATTASAYGAFALAQVLMLAASSPEVFPRAVDTAAYVALALSMWVGIEGFVYARMNSTQYRRAFATFALVSGLVLVFRK